MKKSRWAIVSLILGLVSFIQLLGIERAILAVIFGILALKEIEKETNINGKNIAYIGIILGIIYILIISVISIMHYSRIINLFKILK